MLAFSFLSDLQNETYCSHLSSLFLSHKIAHGLRPQPAGSIRQAGPCSHVGSHSVPLATVHLLQSSNLSTLQHLGWVLCWFDLQGETCAFSNYQSIHRLFLGRNKPRKKTNNPIHLQYYHMLDMLLHTVSSKMRLYKLYGYKN